MKGMDVRGPISDPSQRREAELVRILKHHRRRRLDLEESKPMYPHILKRINEHIDRLDKKIDLVIKELTTINKDGDRE